MAQMVLMRKLGSRGEQYERFYLASGARNQQLAHMIADRSRADRLVERFLNEDAVLAPDLKLAEAV
jgi:hypothetical protein